MRNLLVFAALWLVVETIVAGCARRSPEAPDAHASLVWVESAVHEGVTIDLGFREEEMAEAGWIEPIAKIARGGSPVADAMVFCGVVSADGERLGAEEATVYESPSGSDAALYACGRLYVPDGASPRLVRFRIVLPDGGEDWVKDVAAPAR